MTKWFSSLFLLSSTLITTSLSAWGSAEYIIPSLQSPPTPTLAVATFPLNADQEWFIKPSLLIWRPYQDDIDSGFTLVMPSSNPLVEKDKTRNVDFEWGTGVRLTIGKYLPHHEQWDVSLASTFFYSDTEETIRGKGLPASLASLSDVKVIEDGWNPSLLGISLETKLNWRINYFTWDLAVGRLYNLTPKIVIHPYLCLRSMLIYEKYTTKNDSASINSLGQVDVRDTKFNALNSIWGIGPRLGTDFNFYFGRGWSFMGGLSGAITMGRYKIKENIDGFVLATLVTPSVDATLKIRDRDTTMRTNLEGNLGLAWEKWVRKHTVRIMPSFMFEVSQWFFINNWVATNLPSTTGLPDFGMLSTRRMGDLGFLGFTVNLQVDF